MAKRKGIQLQGEMETNDEKEEERLFITNNRTRTETVRGETKKNKLI